MFLHKILALALGLGLDLATANNYVSDYDMRNRHDIVASAGAPEWRFTSNEWCQPTHIFNNDGSQTPWGTSGCVDPGNDRARDFPTFFWVRDCSNVGEFRVMYNLYFPWSTNFAGGHQHDWEYVVLKWVRAGDGNWYRERFITGAHGNHNKWMWRDWPNTVTWGDRNWRKEADHPIVFIQANGHGTGHDSGGYGWGAWYWSADWLINAWGDYSKRYDYQGTTPPWKFGEGQSHDLCGPTFN